MEVYIRPARVSDAEKMLAAMNEGSAQNLSFFSEPVSLERQREYLQSKVDSPTDYLYVIKDFEGDVLLGTVGLHEIDRFNKNARLGILIFNPDLRRSGIGSEAVRAVLRRGFRGYGLNKVYAKCFVTNRKMQIFLLRLGFRPEAILEKEYLLRDEYHDMVKMVIFEQDYLTNGGQQ